MQKTTEIFSLQKNLISDKKLLFVFSYTIMHRNNKKGQPV